MGYWFSYNIVPHATPSEWREIRALFKDKLVDWDLEVTVWDYRKSIGGSSKNIAPANCDEIRALSTLFPTTVFELQEQGEEGGSGSALFCNGERVKKRFAGTVLNGTQRLYLHRCASMAGVEHRVALMPSGRVAVDGLNRHGECNVLEWTQIVQADCGEKHTVGLRVDGSVVACGSNANGQCDVENLGSKATAVSCGRYHTAILLENGKVLVRGHTEENSESIQPGWRGKMELQVRISRSPKIRAQVNERMEFVSSGDPLRLVRNTKVYEEYPVLDVFNTQGEYLGWLMGEETKYIADNLDILEAAVGTPMPLSKAEKGKKNASMTVRIQAKKTKKEKEIQQTPHAHWPPVVKIAAVYDAVVGVTAQGEIYQDGYHPFANEEIRGLLK